MTVATFTPRTPRRTYNPADFMDGMDSLLSNTDFTPAIQAAIDAAAADPYGPGQVILPECNKPLYSPVIPKNGVDIIGQGWGKTVLRPQGALAAFRWVQSDGASPSNPLIDVKFADFEIDGSEQASGSYNSVIKGTYILWNYRCTWEHIYCHDTGATGLGNDNHATALYDDCLVEGCGRLGTAGVSPGASGIGIGTSAAWGTLVPTNGFGMKVVNCTTRGNKNHGVFFESQGAGDLQQSCQVINITSTNNGQYGLGDAGCNGLIVIGGSLKANTQAGFAAFEGSLAGVSAPGIRGKVIGVDSVSNGTHGFQVRATVAAGGGEYKFENCSGRSNTLSGVSINNGNSALTGVVVDGGDFYSNGEGGITVTSTGGAVNDLHVVDARAYNNGQTTAASVRSGFHASTALVRPYINGNHFYDNQGTKKQTYGINLSGAVTDGNISDNDLRGNLTGAINGQSNVSTGMYIGDNPGWTVAAGTPEANVTAPVGTVYKRTDGGAGTSMYVKEAGTGNTGWVGK